MKKITTLLVALLCGLLPLGAEQFTHPFEIIVKEGATDVSFQIGGVAEMKIDWGDGTIENISLNESAVRTFKHDYTNSLKAQTIVTFEATGIERFKNDYNESASIVGVGTIDAPDLKSFYFMSYKGSTLAQSKEGIVDLSKCPKLKYLFIKDAPGIQLGAHPELEQITINSSPKEDDAFASISNQSLNLSNYPMLNYIWIEGQSNLHNINVSNLSKLRLFRMQMCGLTNAIGLRTITKENKALKRVNIAGHSLPLSQLPPQNSDFTYDEYNIQYDSEGYKIDNHKINGVTVDLSDMATEYDFTGTEHHGSITWQKEGASDNLPTNTYTEKNGIFTFNEALFGEEESVTLQAIFTPAFFTKEDLTGKASSDLKSNSIVLNKSDIPQPGVSLISLVTDKRPGETIKLNIKANGAVTAKGLKEEVVLDAATDYTITSQRITLSGDITYLDCHSNKLTHLSLSQCDNLTTLSCEDNLLTCSALEDIAEALPNRSSLTEGVFNAITSEERSVEPGSGNVLTKHAADIAKSKNWLVHYLDAAGSDNTTDYEGRDGSCTDNELSFAVTTSEAANGQITIKGTNNLEAVPYGTGLIVEVAPEAGYELDKLMANDEDITATKRFVVKSNVTVTATFKTGAEAVTRESISLYPNPTNNEANLFGVAPQTDVIIYGTDGTQLLTVTADQGGHAVLLVEGLPEGSYLVAFRDASGKLVTRQLTVKR